ncbi:zinc-ribbon domain-containing protein [Metallosphaera javensis (ex Hofmann et al. 2022)]
MKKCPRCGYENDDTASICEKCRYPLTLSTEPVFPHQVSQMRL